MTFSNHYNPCPPPLDYCGPYPTGDLLNARQTLYRALNNPRGALDRIKPKLYLDSYSYGFAYPPPKPIGKHLLKIRELKNCKVINRLKESDQIPYNIDDVTDVQPIYNEMRSLASDYQYNHIDVSHLSKPNGNTRQHIRFTDSQQGTDGVPPSVPPRSASTDPQQGTNSVPQQGGPTESQPGTDKIQRHSRFTYPQPGTYSVSQHNRFTVSQPGTNSVPQHARFLDPQPGTDNVPPRGGRSTESLSRDNGSVAHSSTSGEVSAVVDLTQDTNTTLPKSSANHSRDIKDTPQTTAAEGGGESLPGGSRVPNGESLSGGESLLEGESADGMTTSSLEELNEDSYDVDKANKFYRCDFCAYSCPDEKTMVGHLNGARHSEASLCIFLCDNKYIYKERAVKMAEGEASKCILCPDCHDIFDDVHSCAFHSRKAHHSDTGHYGIHDVLSTDVIRSRRCVCHLCHVTFKQWSSLFNHWLNFDLRCHSLKSSNQQRRVIYRCRHRIQGRPCGLVFENGRACMNHCLMHGGYEVHAVVHVLSGQGVIRQALPYIAAVQQDAVEYYEKEKFRDLLRQTKRKSKSRVKRMKVKKLQRQSQGYRFRKSWSN